jgi:hypothetical protein
VNQRKSVMITIEGNLQGRVMTQFSKPGFKKAMRESTLKPDNAHFGRADRE